MAMTPYLPCEGRDSGEWNHAPREPPDGPDGLCAACRAAMVAADAAGPQQWDRLAMQRERGEEEGIFEHFYYWTGVYSVVGSDPIWRVRLTLDEAGPYHGWKYSHHPSNRNDRGEVSMVHRNIMQVKVSLGSGDEALTKRGRGTLVRLRVQPLRLAEPNEGILRGEVSV